MQLKLITANNFKDRYVVLEESGDVLSVVNESGEYSQVDKRRFEIDHVENVDAVEAHLHEKSPKIKQAILKQRAEDIVSEISDLLNLNLKQGNSPSHFIADDTHLHVFTSCYQNENDNCEVIINENQLNVMQDGLREVVVLVLEEFGNLYLDGQKLREYLNSVKTKTKKHGKRSWTLTVDYENLVSVKGHKSFQYYSDDMNFIRNFSFDNTNNNIVDLNAIRKVSDLRRNLTRRDRGIKLRTA